MLGDGNKPRARLVAGVVIAAAGVVIVVAMGGTDEGAEPGPLPGSMGTEATVAGATEGATSTITTSNAPPAGGSAVNRGVAVEIIEAPDRESGSQAGGDGGGTPVESAGTDGWGGLASAQGATYTWQDGDRLLQARLQLDLVAADDGSIISREGVAVDRGEGQAGDGDRTIRNGDASDRVDGQPVFRSGSGELMTLPGGVIVTLDPGWDTEAVDGFFMANGISLGRVSELEFLTNAFVVDTRPGFSSLYLANALVGQVGVELSSPNWRRERVAK